jgi:uncharacterized protein
MKYKKSRFNILVPYKNGCTIIFNGFSGAIGLFDKNATERYRKNRLTESEMDALEKKGILVSQERNELDEINSIRRNAVSDTSEKTFRIWTTSCCNARCFYCFEKGFENMNTMTENTADAVVRFILSLVQEGDHILLEWFGGEPLLNWKIIDYICDALKPVLKEKNCTVRGTMITNGSLLTREIADKMRTSWRIVNTQITLDGYGEEYDRIKSYLGSRYSFKDIISNIKMLTDAGVRVTVRMNYTSDNYDSMVKLVDYLLEEMAENTRIHYYFYPVWNPPTEGKPSSTHVDANFLKLMDKLVAYGMTTPRRAARMNGKKYSCNSRSAGTYAIFPNGNIGICSESASQVFGNVFEGIRDTEKRSKWTDGSIDKECESCTCLPLCQGGCMGSKYTQMNKCFLYKDAFPEILKWCIGYLEKDAAAQKQKEEQAAEDLDEALF